MKPVKPVKPTPSVSHSGAKQLSDSKCRHSSWHAQCVKNLVPFDQLGKLITSATTSPKEAWIAPPGVQDEDGKSDSSCSA